MIDTHTHPDNWGIRPILFHLGGIGIPSYSFFVLLGLLVGLAVYFYEARRLRERGDYPVYILFGSLVGGIIGAKILEWAINYEYVSANFFDHNVLFSGRTIVGGLLGGVVGSLLTKRILGIKVRKGNLFAPGVALGVGIGRIGCFMSGCCYGKLTALPWGVDFGDGILRHPTQLYESAFMLAMFIWLERVKTKEGLMPGQLFKMLMLAYFVFRFFSEFLRVEKPAFWGLSVFQIISMGVIIYLLRDEVKNYSLKFLGRTREATDG